jgi:uncharacterized protein YfkK (UPF0435 family)
MKSFILEIKPLYPDIKTEIKILTPNDGISVSMSKASYHVAIYSEEKEGYQENAGFILQQLDLWLSANGLGSCWRGGPQLKSAILKLSSLKYVILLSIGYPAEPLYRTSLNEFERKHTEEIWHVNGLDELAEPVRLAPSGMNHQPWLFEGLGNDQIQVFCKKRKILSNKILYSMDRIGIGIAICHLWLACEMINKKMEIIEKVVSKNDWKDLTSIYVLIMRSEGVLYSEMREKILDIKKKA